MHPKILTILLVLGLLAVACQPGSPVPGTPTTMPTVGLMETPSQAPAAPDVPTGIAGIPATGEDLANTQWRLTSFAEQGVETSTIKSAQPTLKFEEMGHAVGSGGCNIFSTQYVVQDGTLTFDQIISTEIACTADGVMEQEQRYFQMLQSAGRFELTGDRLVIHVEDGASMLNFVRNDNSSTPTSISSLLCSTIGEGPNPGWTLCRSQDYGFEAQYPPEADMINHSATSARINLPFPPDVNLTEKYLIISVTEKSGICSSPLVEGRPPGSFRRETVQINGLEFLKETGQEAATGSVYNWEAYSISRDDKCVSLSFVLRSFRPQLQATPPTQFDLQQQSEIFTEIVSTFAWLETSGEPTPATEHI